MNQTTQIITLQSKKLLITLIVINIIIQQLHKSRALFLCVAEQKLSARPTARWQPKKGYRWTTLTRSGQNRAKKTKKKQDL